MNSTWRCLSAAVLIAATGLVQSAPASAAPPEYPTRSIRLIVPFAPGGSNDIMARLIGQHFSESMGQAVIVDNRPGAGGIIGTDAAAKSPPDGYTLLMMSVTLAVNPSLRLNLPYDTHTDLLP